MKKLFLMMGLVCFQAVSAQDTIAVQKPGASASWKIVYSQAPAQSGSAPVPVSPVARPSEVKYTVSGSLALVETRFEDGTLRTAYLVGGEELSRNSRTNRIRWLRQSEYTSGDASCTSVYPGFEWVAARYLVGKDKINGKSCDHYRFVPEQVVEGEAVRPQEAWVSTEGRPIAFINGTRRGEYQFFDPPKTPMEIPKEFLEYREERMRRAR